MCFSLLPQLTNEPQTWKDATEELRGKRPLPGKCAAALWVPTTLFKLQIRLWMTLESERTPCSSDQDRIQGLLQWTRYEVTYYRIVLQFPETVSSSDECPVIFVLTAGRTALHPEWTSSERPQENPAKCLKWGRGFLGFFLCVCVKTITTHSRRVISRCDEKGHITAKEWTTPWTSITHLCYLKGNKTRNSGSSDLIQCFNE